MTQTRARNRMPKSDRLTRRNDLDRVLRGGNWNNNANNCRTANRNNNNPDNRNNNIGFRVVLAPAHPERWMTLSNRSIFETSSSCSSMNDCKKPWAK